MLETSIQVLALRGCPFSVQWRAVNGACRDGDGVRLTTTTGGGTEILSTRRTVGPQTASGTKSIARMPAGYGWLGYEVMATGRSAWGDDRSQRTVTASSCITVRSRSAWSSCTHAMSRAVSTPNTSASGLTPRIAPTLLGRGDDSPARKIIRPNSPRVMCWRSVSDTRRAESHRKTLHGSSASVTHSSITSSHGRLGATSREGLA